jgi:predicted site-specific integrase-resolvase
MKASDVMKKYNICRQTLCRWVKEDLIEYTVLPSGRYDYGKYKSDFEEEVILKRTVIYARVSTTGQKENLTRQIDRLKNFASANGFVIDEIYSETASALNYNRQKYNKLLNEIFEKKIKNVIIEYKDRLVRIGFDQFENICKKFDVNLIVVDNTENTEKNVNKELTEDLISIIHHFSSKMYSLRRNKKKIEELILEN